MGEFKTGLAKVNDAYFPMIQRELEGNKIEFSNYAKSCTLNAIGAINKVLDGQGIKWDSEALDTSDLTQTLLTIATLQLNPTASPNEVYFQIRNVSVKNQDGKTTWKKKIEMGIEGDGFDSLLARFGRNIKKVCPFWLVKENDDFEYPKYNGLEFTPPQWTPKGTGKVVRVVYPIIHNDDTIHFYISERADVKKNLIAHIANNMMNETFGVCADRYKATDEQKKEISERKKEVLESAKLLTLDGLLEDEKFEKYISPAWREEQSSESMIVRKMRNNIVKKIPKDFSSSLANEMFNQATDETYRQNKQDIIEAESTPLEDIRVDKETGEVIENPEF